MPSIAFRTLLTLLLVLCTRAFAAVDPELIARLKSPDALTRTKAAQAVYESNETPDELLPILFEISLARRSGTPKEQMTSGVAIHYANQAIANAGKRAIPRLRELARDPETRWKAIGIINRVGADAEDALPEIILCIQDSNENVRSLAIRTVTKLGAKGGAATDALIPAINDSKESNREAAIEALGEIGPGAKAAIPALKKALKSRDILVPSGAKAALQKIER